MDLVWYILYKITSVLLIKVLIGDTNNKRRGNTAIHASQICFKSVDGDDQ
jgi:hypothetical protein